MSLTTSAVTVRQLPERISTEQGRLFLDELEGLMNVTHPCIVLDCSRMVNMDMPAIHLLLDCLEHAMKHNGDVKLAAVPEEAKAMLEVTGVSRLFEQFGSSAEAVCSYQPVPLQAGSHGSALSAQAHHAQEDAA